MPKRKWVIQLEQEFSEQHSKQSAYLGKAWLYAYDKPFHVMLFSQWSKPCSIMRIYGEYKNNPVWFRPCWSCSHKYFHT